MPKHALSISNKKRHLTFFIQPCFVISFLFTTASTAWSSTEDDYLPPLSKASQLTADGGTFLRIKGKGSSSTLDVTGSDIAGSAYTAFDVDGKKTFKAAELKSSQSSSNKSFGWNAGLAVSFGQGASFGFTGGANYGKGYSDGKGTHYRLAHGGSLTGHTDLGDGQTTLIGAQILGKGLSGNTRDLTIISPQGLQRYDSRQVDASGQITIGYGVSGGGSFGYSKVHQHKQSINANSGSRDAADALSGGDARSRALAGSINRNNNADDMERARLSGQSGLFAGDDGFQIHNTGTAYLEGGIITSSAKAEAAGRNAFSTDRLVLKHLDNHSIHKGKSFGMGLSANISGHDLGQQQSPGISNVGGDKSGISRSLGFGQDKGEVRGTTHASINTANIRINAMPKAEAAVLAWQANRGIRTETSGAQSGAAHTGFDARKVEEKINLERAVTQEFDRTTQGVKRELRNHAQNLRDSGRHQEAERFDTLALGVDIVKSALYSPNSNGTIGSIANAGAPIIAHQIGQHAKAAGTEGSAGHILAHSALGAATAALSGNDPSSAALAAGGSEAIVPLAGQLLYGKAPAELDATEKANLGTIANTLGVAIGAAVGDSGTAAIAAGEAARGAVDNNFLNPILQSQLEASRQRIWEGRGTREDAQTVVTANRQDQHSDYLRNKRNRGEALTAQEDAYLRNALIDLYLGTAALYGDDIARQSVRDVLNTAPGQSSMRPMNYTYPFAGSKEQQKEWERLNPDRVTYFRIDQGPGTALSQAHSKAFGMLNAQAHREQLSLMGDGTFIAAGAPGIVGKITMATLVGTGGAHLAAGGQSLSKGEKLDAAWHFVNAAINLGGAGAGKHLGKNPAAHTGMENLAGLGKANNTMVDVHGNYTANSLNQSGVSAYIPQTGSKLNHTGTGIFGPKGGEISAPQYVERGTLNPVYKDSAGKYFVETNTGNRKYLPSRELKIPHSLQQPESASKLHRPPLRVETIRNMEKITGFQRLPDGSYYNFKTQVHIKEPHIGHAYGWENRRILQAADEMGMSQQQLNDFVNSKYMWDKFRIETKADNLSHKFEKPGIDDLQQIKDRMTDFLKEQER